jgi:hypothetical protein
MGCGPVCDKLNMPRRFFLQKLTNLVICNYSFKFCASAFPPGWRVFLGGGHLLSPFSPETIVAQMKLGRLGAAERFLIPSGDNLLQYMIFFIIVVLDAQGRNREQWRLQR